MPVFVSYSSKDRKFADRFALQLVKQKVHVWFDKWELHAGDSLITKIQAAVGGASALLVILSKASVTSEWCKKELNAGLMRELEEKRVVVVPILLEECEIPVFLREKLYADFRSNFDDGMRTVLEAIAKVTNEYQARIDAPEFHSDWAIDWNMQSNGLLALRITIAEQAQDQPYTCLTVLTILCSSEATEQYQRRTHDEDGENARRDIVGVLAKAIEGGLDLTVWLDDQFEKGHAFELQDKNTGAMYRVSISSRRMGEDTGRDILLRTGQQIRQIHHHMSEVARRSAARA